MELVFRKGRIDEIDDGDDPQHNGFRITSYMHAVSSCFLCGQKSFPLEVHNLELLIFPILAELFILPFATVDSLNV